MLFSEVVDALRRAHDAATSAARNNRRMTHAQSEELARGLVHAAAAESESELRALLGILLPSEDREHVYGLKTRRLMHWIAGALQKMGPTTEAAKLRAWTPVACRSELMSSGSGALVCLPEAEVAAAVTAAAGASSLLVAREGSRRGGWAVDTLRDVARVCDRLTATYHAESKGRREAVYGTRIAAWHVEDFVRLLEKTTQKRQHGGLDFHGWLLLIRVLLKRIPIGLGPAAVFRALPLPAAASFYARQRSLDALAHACCVDKLDDGAAAYEEARAMRVRCGTPFRFMTCDAMRSPSHFCSALSFLSPYLLKWVFSREETLRRPIPPVDGRLVILPAPSAATDGTAKKSGQWYVPMNARQKLRMVDLEDERVLDANGRRNRRHWLVLRAIKQAGLIQEQNAEGLMLFYTLSAEDNGRLVCLIRDAAPVLESGVELVASAGPSSVGGSDEPVAAFRTLPRAEFLPLLIAAASPGAASFVSGGRIRGRIEVIAAPRTTPSRRGGNTRRKRTEGTGRIQKLQDGRAMLGKIRGKLHVSSSPNAQARKVGAIAGGASARALGRPSVASKGKNTTSPDEGEEGLRGPRRSQRISAQHASVLPSARGMRDGGTAHARRADAAGGATRHGHSDDEAEEEEEEVNAGGGRPEERRGVIAQIKLDGDRLQAHVYEAPPVAPVMVSAQPHEERREHQTHQHDRRRQSASSDPPAPAENEAQRPTVAAVCLFSKNGYDVSEIYSNIRDELAQRARALAPCIFDGELIVVDSDSGAPLPWESEKWRYNKRHPVVVSPAPDVAADDAREEDGHGHDGGSGSGAVGGGDHNEASDEEEEATEGVYTAIQDDNDLKSGDDWETASEAASIRDGVRGGLTFLPSRAAAKRLGVSVRRMHRAEGTGDGGAGREKGACVLRFVLFDLLMLRGVDMSHQPYSARLERLQKEVGPLLRPGRGDGGEGPLPHVRVIDSTEWISTASELVGLLRKATERGWEGYVVKDPDAPYEFGQTACVQKVKLTGPDINAGVMGAGFSLSTNPRRWGLATALRSPPPPPRSLPPAAAASAQERRRGGGEPEEQEDEDEEEERVAEFYCRTETLEGDRPGRALEVVLGLVSKVRVSDVRKAAQALLRARARGEEEPRSASVASHASLDVRVQWVQTRRIRGGRGGRNHAHADASRPTARHTHNSADTRNKEPSDETIEIEWRYRRGRARNDNNDNDDNDNDDDDEGGGGGGLRRPRARLSSLEGRVRIPLSLVMEESRYDIQWLCSPWECPFALSLRGDIYPLDGYAPRHPVGRPEIVGYDATHTWDTRASARRKFEEARDVSTCIEMHTARRIQRIRALPPSRSRLEEVARIAMGWMGATAAANAAAHGIGRGDGGHGGEEEQQVAEEVQRGHEDRHGEVEHDASKHKQDQGEQNRSDHPLARKAAKKTKRTASAVSRLDDPLSNTERWPQLPPAKPTTINGYSDMIVNAGEVLCGRVPIRNANDVQPQTKDVQPQEHDGGALHALIRSAFRKLAPEEREALADLPPRSLWGHLDKMLARGRGVRGGGGGAAPQARSQDEAEEAAELRGREEELQARLKEFRETLGGGIVLIMGGGGSSNNNNNNGGSGGGGDGAIDAAPVANDGGDGGGQEDGQRTSGVVTRGMLRRQQQQEGRTATTGAAFAFSSSCFLQECITHMPLFRPSYSRSVSSDDEDNDDDVLVDEDGCALSRSRRTSCHRSGNDSIMANKDSSSSSSRLNASNRSMACMLHEEYHSSQDEEEEDDA